MPTEPAKNLLEALKIAKANKAGLPIQIQTAVAEIAASEDPEFQRTRAQEVSRWLFVQSNEPGVDRFTQLGYNALRGALAPFIPD